MTHFKSNRISASLRTGRTSCNVANSSYSWSLSNAHFQFFEKSYELVKCYLFLQAQTTERSKWAVLEINPFFQMRVSVTAGNGNVFRFELLDGLNDDHVLRIMHEIQITLLIRLSLQPVHLLGCE
jgi:hypothetical protein